MFDKFSFFLKFDGFHTYLGNGISFSLKCLLDRQKIVGNKLSAKSDSTVSPLLYIVFVGLHFLLVYLNRLFLGFVNDQITQTSKEFSSNTLRQICIKLSHAFLQILYSKTVFCFFDKLLRSAAKAKTIRRVVNLFIFVENDILEVH